MYCIHTFLTARGKVTRGWPALRITIRSRVSTRWLRIGDGITHRKREPQRFNGQFAEGGIKMQTSRPVFRAHGGEAYERRMRGVATKRRLLKVTCRNRMQDAFRVRHVPRLALLRLVIRPGAFRPRRLRERIASSRTAGQGRPSRAGHRVFRFRLNWRQRHAPLLQPICNSPTSGRPRTTARRKAVRPAGLWQPNRYS